MNNYELSVTKKFDYFFENKKISNIIYLHDEENNERLDHVLFVEDVNGNVVGIYKIGMNPLFSENRIYDLDDFNLFDSYDGLIECKEEFNLTVECITLFFSNKYNELLCFYLSDSNLSSSLLIILYDDEIYLRNNCSKCEITKFLGKRVLEDGFITYEKKFESDWKKINL